MLINTADTRDVVQAPAIHLFPQNFYRLQIPLSHSVSQYQLQRSPFWSTNEGFYLTYIDVASG